MSYFDQAEFRTSDIVGEARVDRTAGPAGTIFGAKAMQLGPLAEGDSRPFKVDFDTLTQVAGFVNAVKTGKKSRLSHKSGIDSHLGKATSARVVGDASDPNAHVLIDVAMSRAATKTPRGNLADYVLDMAEDTPEDFGLSVAGTKLDVAAMKAAKGEDGLYPIRFKGIKAIDFSGDPAGTHGGLFDIDDSSATFDDSASWLIETHLADMTRAEAAQRFDEFLTNHFSSKGDDMTPEQTAEFDAAKARIVELEAANADLTAKTTTETVVFDVDMMEALDAQNKLARKSELTALCKLANVGDEDRDLMFTAGFDTKQAQEWIKTSGHLATINPGVADGELEKKKPTKEDEFGAEFDQFSDIYERQGITREDFIASRKADSN